MTEDQDKSSLHREQQTSVEIKSNTRSRNWSQRIKDSQMKLKEYEFNMKCMDILKSKLTNALSVPKVYPDIEEQNVKCYVVIYTCTSTRRVVLDFALDANAAT